MSTQLAEKYAKEILRSDGGDVSLIRRWLVAQGERASSMSDAECQAAWANRNVPTGRAAPAPQTNGYSALEERVTKVEQGVKNLADFSATMFKDLEKAVEYEREKDREAVDARIVELINLHAPQQASAQPVTVTVQRPDLPDIQIDGAHKQLPQLIDYLRADVIPYLCGGAGAGKTHASRQAAEALGLPFAYIGTITEASQYLGFVSPIDRTYQRTAFRDAFEHGGVFLFDEYDGAPYASETLPLNAVFAGDSHMPFPDGMVKRSDDFKVIVTGNTRGSGATSTYNRERQDGATMDRFGFIEWEIDPAIEQALALGNTAWYERVVAVREAVQTLGMDFIISPRATQKGARLLAAGRSMDEVEIACLFGQMDPESVAEVCRHA